MNDAKTIFIYDDGIGSVSLVDHMGSDITVVNSARVSFGIHKSDLDRGDKRLINYLIKHRHTSTLEHNLITFKFVVPLFVRSQHHRHRTWSYNEISRRYTDKDLQFYLPKSFRTQHESNRQASNEEILINPPITLSHRGLPLEDAYIETSDAVAAFKDDAVSLYNLMLSKGVCREQARMVLPQNLYTEYYGTVNLNNLLKFIDLRTHEGAQWEIQKVAEACLGIAADLFPVTVNAYRKVRDAS
jgi:thymidylate synthase (FAD)